MRDKALFPCSASRAIKISLSKLKSRLESLYESQEFPQGICRNSRTILRIQQQLEMCPMYPTSSQDGGRFPFFNLRGIPTFPSHLKGRTVSHIETREEPQASCHKLKRHRVPNQLVIKTFFCTDQREPRVSPHKRKGGLTHLLHL